MGLLYVHFVKFECSSTFVLMYCYDVWYIIDDQSFVKQVAILGGHLFFSHRILLHDVHLQVHSVEHIEAVEHTEKMLSRSISASCIFFAIIFIGSVSGGSYIMI